MTRAAILACGLLSVISASTLAASNEVRYAAAPNWTIPVPVPTDAVTPPGASVRIKYQDFQVYAGPNGSEYFTATRLSILKPEGLAAGNIQLAWSSDAGDATMHFLRIIRDGKTINVLDAAKFQVLRREEDLENAVLNGKLTAVLQVPGLQVGDDIEFAATVRHKDPTLGDHFSGVMQLTPGGTPGAFRARVVWPQARRVNWRTSRDLPPVQEAARGSVKEVVVELRDPSAAVGTRGAPDRFNIRRLVEFTDFDSWREVSARIWPLYDKAAVLPRGSPVRQEVARIAAATQDPQRRAEAALQLVESQIRYVYVGLDGGNLTPATVADTWTRRFGDCKAKTVLLLAMLRELGIEAEPVLVQTPGGDGLDERLPSPGQFDHVLVRARIAGTLHWLDGTRLGDISLAGVPVPNYRWVLPLRNGGADIEAIPPVSPVAPDLISVLEIDASGGFRERANVRAQTIIRGDEGYALQVQLSAMTPADAERGLRSYWQQGNNWIEVDTARWTFDEAGRVLRLLITGTAKLEWTGDEANGRDLNIPGAGFTPPAEYRRPKDEDQSAPWVTEYPGYRCWATSIRLPPATARWLWDYRANPVDLKMGGLTYWRVSDMREGVVRTVMSRRNDVPEISAEEARQVNDKVDKDFDNNISQVFQIARGKATKAHPALPAAPFTADTDWMSASTPCGKSTGSSPR
jgi:hypothetical protein